MTALTIMRVGSVGASGAYHFMRDESGDRTACGKVASDTYGCTKSHGIHRVNCGSCWRVKRAATLPQI